ncbi:MAG: hypothetical protein HY910_09710 [Desulfarculus sp.]|nr:hypothetical protein [Desulfarculus sp.]
MPTVIDSITGTSFYQPEYPGLTYAVPPARPPQLLPMVDRAQDMALMAADHPSWIDRAKDPALMAADHPTWKDRGRDPALLAADHRGLVVSSRV